MPTTVKLVRCEASVTWVLWQPEGWAAVLVVIDVGRTGLDADAAYSEVKRRLLADPGPADAMKAHVVQSAGEGPSTQERNS